MTCSDLSLIVAMSENRVIGRDGDLPWRLPADLRRFKKLTMGHTMVMGRKTWESIGRALPGRRSVVLTRQADYEAPGADVVGDLDAALALADDHVFVIGGAAVFAEALPISGRLFLTRVHADVEGDVAMPAFEDSVGDDGRRWYVVEQEKHEADERHAHAFSFEDYARITPCSYVGRETLTALLQRYELELVWLNSGDAIPGSHWGAPEAGLQGTKVYVRPDTPVHSLLHEAGHAICVDGQRRLELDTDAGGTDDEENGVCYLQILLADEIPGVGRDRLMEDMDRWGYSFRLGSTRAWFENDAADARAWLLDQGLLTDAGRPTWRLRS